MEGTTQTQRCYHHGACLLVWPLPSTDVDLPPPSVSFQAQLGVSPRGTSLPRCLQAQPSAGLSVALHCGWLHPVILGCVPSRLKALSPKTAGQGDLPVRLKGRVEGKGAVQGPRGSGA